MVRILDAEKPSKREEEVHIACINDATVPLGVPFDALTRALQKAYDEHFLPVWGYPVKLYVAREPRRKQDWRIVYLDDAGEAGYYGYHDLTYHGTPISKVFVKDTLASGDDISLTASHELFEMVIDPIANMWAEQTSRTLVAYEMCDAVEDEAFLVDGMQISNFVYPTWFEKFRHPKGTKYDHLGVLKAPFAMSKGGYVITRVDGHVGERFASKAKERAFAREDRRGHRSEYRKTSGDAKLIPGTRKKKSRAR